MINNREIVYQIRKHLPENQALHNFLAKRKLNEYKKLLIPEEYVLRGEKDPSSIPEIVKEFEEKRSDQIIKLTDSFNEYLKKAKIKFSDKEYDENRIYMLFDCLAYGFAPDEYMYYKLKERNLEEKKAYITNLDRICLQYIMNDFKELQYLFDKTATYEKLGRFYKRDEISVASSRDYNKFLEFVEKHSVFVVKQVSESCGHGIQILEADYNALETQYKGILSLGKCSLEEKIVQSDIMSKFNESSVNTVRVRSFNTKSGIKIGPCSLRTGRAGSIVDNGGSGGVMAAVDRNTGVVDTDGHDEYLNKYEVHPTSFVPFYGFQIPEWDSCISLVKEMCGLLPKLGFIGWDLAHTNNGWVLVEANGGSQFASTQICYGRGCKKEIEKYVDDRNILE